MVDNIGGFPTQPLTRSPRFWVCVLLCFLVIAATPLRSPKDSLWGIIPEPLPIPLVRGGEIWVAPYASNVLGSWIITGQGTQAQPYSGDFDAIVGAVPPSSTIHLGAGMFYTKGRGSWHLKTNHRLAGAGENATTIQRDPTWSFDQNQPVLLGQGDNITIEDLTIDAACTNGEAFVHSAVSIFGRCPELRRVSAIRVSGSWPYRECFSYFICPPANNPASGGLISECSLSQVMGNYVNGFCIWGGAKVVNCTVEFPILTNNSHPPSFIGYQAAYSYGAQFSGCTQIGGTGVFYSDTGSDSFLQFERIDAINVMQGFIMVRQPGQYVDGLIVDHCIIELSTNTQTSLGANGIAISGATSTAGSKRNVRISNNVIRYVGGAQGPAENIGLLAAAVVDGDCRGTIIEGNVWDADFRCLPATDSDYATVSTNTPMARAAVPVSPPAPQ